MRPWLCLLFVGGCYSPSYSDCVISCATSHECPSGLQCMPDQWCRPSGAVGSCPAPLPDASAADSTADAGYPTGMWAQPNVVTLSSDGMLDPSLTEDMLEMYMMGGGNIYFTTRSAIGQAWEIGRASWREKSKISV